MLKLNVGFTKKVGEANYGSRGASVNLDVELESGVIGDADRLKERIHLLFALAKASVEDELNGHSQVANSRNGTTTTAAGTNGNGHVNENGHANGNGRQRETIRKATASQVRAIHAIVDRQRLDLPALLQQRFGLNAAADLSITEASGLIDEIKGATNGGKR